MTRVRVLLFLVTLAFVAGVGYFVSLLARGYRFDSKTFSLRPRGLFVVTSVPDGASVLVNGKLESATNATLSLPPDSYDIELKKEGYLTWKKHITIKKEEVTKIDVYLFPAAPSLSSLTFAGAANPVLSPDRTKIAYGVPLGEKSDPEKVGIWIMELSDLPIGFSREPRRITNLDPTGLSWQWSPDSRQLLLKKDGSFFVLDISTTSLNPLAPLTDGKLLEVSTKWQEETNKKIKEDAKELPEKISQILGKTPLYFSPDGSKVLYTATSDTTIPEGLVSPLPGSSTQKEERTIKKGNTYTYDIKEDKNFLVYPGVLSTEKDLVKEASRSASIAPITLKKSTVHPNNPDTSLTSLRWFPTGNHLVLAEPNKITIMDYDGTNLQRIYAGPYVAPFAIPFPNASRLLILTNLGADGVSPNLYAVGLK